jgi:putative membrane protein
VDITAELVGQLAYTLLGLGLLAWVKPHNVLAVPVLAAVAGMSALAAAFAAVQARGTGALERLGARLARDWLHVGDGRAGGLAAAMASIWRRPWRLGFSTLIHLGTWVLSGAETWLTLHLMGLGVPLLAALIIDSLLYGIRSLAFMVPNAVGVQEAALVMLGGMFGVGPDAAIALSLVKRARDLAIGIPALLAWQMLEGKRVWHEVAAPVLVPGND